MRTRPGTRIGTGIVIAFIAALVPAGCGGRPDSAGRRPVLPSVAPPAAPSGQLTLDETANGRTVSLSRGATVEVILHSTYWSFTPLVDTNVLAPDGAPRQMASAPGTGCVPGGGCGTVTARFRAVAAGEETVAADRTSCGEARRCTGGEGTYRLHVLVR